MSRTGRFRIVITAALFGLLSTSLVSIGLVKAAHNFSHRAAVTSPHVADRFPTVRSDHLALLIANSNYPDAEAALADVTAGADALATSCATMVSSLPLRGACDPTYNFTVDVLNGNVTHPNILTFRGDVAPSGAVRAWVRVGQKYASGSGRLSGVSGQGVWSGRSGESRCTGAWRARRN